jgi:exodeoxyribonuclease V beta subunit
MTDFDVKKVDLEGSNLIEASAGTGKTYSIGILTLRLIIEKDMPVNKILMVTFTNAAVAELEGRIRKFIRLALQYLDGSINAKNTDGINELIDLIKKNKSLNDDIIRERLKKSERILDETPVMTIHSFCHSILTEYAFECNQMYGTEALHSIDEIISDVVHDFWRKEITKMDADILALLFNPTVMVGDKSRKRLSIDSLIDVVKNELNGQKFEAEINDDLKILKDANENWEIHYENTDWKERLEKHLDTKGIRYKSDQCKKWIQESVNRANFYSKIKKDSAAYVQKIFAKEKEIISNIEGLTLKFINFLYIKVINYSLKKVKDYLRVNKLMTTDELITKVHRSLIKNPEHNNVSEVQSREILIAELRAKYSAVFIDEFQDTDKEQFEIFDTLFGNHETILFYIGDPKQSIYGWRKADLNTYFDAKTNSRVHLMNTNYRSSKNYIAAMNEFFQPQEDFDTFHYKNKDKNNIIDYIKVEAKKNPENIILNKKEIKPLILYSDNPKADVIKKNTAILIYNLLTDGTLKNKTIKPGSIAVLVRKKREGKDIKKELQKYNIPSVTLDSDKIFNSGEAENIGYILETVIELSWKGINKALLNNFTGKSYEDLLEADEKTALDRFKKYQEIWAEKGVYSMLLQFLEDYRVKQHLLSGDLSGGDRILSNFYQVSELLQKAESENNYSKKDLLKFLLRNIEDENEDDEYIQRIENDKEAVTILTIHKSKGLEFDIVIAPFMDLDVKEKGAFTSFRNKNNEYVFVPNKQLGDHEDRWKEQTEQENRRLLYVAVTRAKYACFLFKKKENKTATTLSPFYKALLDKDKKNIDIKTFDLSVNYNEKYISEKHSDLTVIDINIPDLNLKDKHFRKMSYSHLAGDHVYHPKEYKSEGYEDSYEQFIFKDLARGIKAGDMLHNIFEFIDFSDDEDLKWEKVIEQSLSRFLPKDNNEKTQEKLLQMVKTVLKTKINIGNDSFSLSEIERTKRITELEFDFITKRFKIKSLSELENNLPAGYQISHKQNEDIEGLLHGFIDLFFEHEGKYYILDWKSNFLGDMTEDYSKEKMIQAMSESNYHLQYLIYTLAVKKYLSLKNDNFDYDAQFGGVIYIFLRGVREEEDKGIFTFKPEIEAIQKIENIFSKKEINNLIKH